MARRRAHEYSCRWTLLALFLLQTKGAWARGVFSPRVDYDEWTPLGRGDPLKNDPTYDYVPPVLERVHYWLEPASRTPDPPLATTPQPEVPVLRPRQPTPLPPPAATTADAATTAPAQLESRHDVFDQFLKIVDASKFSSNGHHHHNHHHYSSVPASYYASPFYHKPSAPPMRPPYTMLMPPPPPPPTAPALAQPQGQTAVSLQHASLVYHASTSPPLQQALDWKEGKTQLATVAAAPPTAAAPTRAPAAHDAVDLSSLLQSLLRDEATPVTAVVPQSDALTATTTPPATATATVTTCATPMATTVASLTTDPLFSHYKQPAEPLRGPMYLIIQGHSKVKTYGAANKHQHNFHGIPIQNSNDIQQEQDMETDRSGRAVDDEIHSLAPPYEFNTVGTGDDDTWRRTPRSSTEYPDDVFDDTGPSKPARARRKKRSSDISDELQPPAETTSAQNATPSKSLQRNGKSNRKKIARVTPRADIFQKRGLKGLKTLRRVHSAVEATTREIEAILKQNREMSKQLQKVPGIKPFVVPENYMAEATVKEIEAILRENREMSRQLGTLPGYAPHSTPASLVELPLRRSATVSPNEQPQEEKNHSLRNKRQLLGASEEHATVNTDDDSATTDTNSVTPDDQLLQFTSAETETEMSTAIESTSIDPDSQLTIQQERWTTPETVIPPTTSESSVDEEAETSKGRQILEELGELIPLDEDTADQLLHDLLVQQGQGSGAGAVIASSLAKILDVESRT